MPESSSSSGEVVDYLGMAADVVYIRVRGHQVVNLLDSKLVERIERRLTLGWPIT